MKIRMTYAALLGLAACGGVSEPPVATLPSSYDQVALAEIDTPEKLTSRCESDEAAFRERLAAIEAFDGSPTIENYYVALDSLIASAVNLQSHASSLSGVHPDPELRSAGEACELLVNAFFSDLSLSRPVYDAI